MLEKAKEEQEEVVAKYGKELTMESLASMEYLNAVVQETMRVNPVIKLVVRKCVQTFEIGGYRYFPTSTTDSQRENIYTYSNSPLALPRDFPKS